MHQRANTILEKFKKEFNQNPLMVQACGRINLIGEHTDYNKGLVLPAAIDKYLFFAIAPSNRPTIRFMALDIDDQFEISTSDLRPSNKTWANYLLGIIYQFQQGGVDIKGLDCVFGGNLPIGAGMSSSAALECGLAYGLNHLFQVGIERADIARLAQRSSNQFLGIPCGIMDQFSSMMGKEAHVIRLDCRSLEYEYVPFDIQNYDVVLLNTKVHHQLANSAYSDRVRECQTAVDVLRKYYPEVNSLRDAKLAMVTENQKELGETVAKRASYVITENERLETACEYLKGGDINSMGDLMFQTHRGLRDQYEVSCKELDFLVVVAEKYDGVVGARMMGGGFGGVTINLVEKDKTESFIRKAEKDYKEGMNIDLEAHLVKVSNGTEVMDC